MPVRDKEMIGRINEVFSSIQGEGIYWGEKQIFVRFADCNLNCSYCDTDFREFREYPAEALLAEIRSLGREYHSVSFTGGEPLLQEVFLKEILGLVKKDGYKTYLETNGTLSAALREVLDKVDIIAMDIKLPSSIGTGSGFWPEHREFLRIASVKDVFIKVVVGNSTGRSDLLVMLDLLKEEGYGGTLVLQPNSYDRIETLQEKLDSFQGLCRQYNFTSRVIPQMHKIMGVR